MPLSKELLDINRLSILFGGFSCAFVCVFLAFIYFFYGFAG